MPRSPSWLPASVVAGTLLMGGLGAAEITLVEDEANLLAQTQKEEIEAHHRYLLEDFDIDYRVITKASAGDLVRFGVDRFRAQGIGRESRHGHGLLLVIDPAQNQVRLEVSYSLEGVYTDAFVSYIQREQMLPFFRTGRIGEGILATTELIVQRAVEANEQGSFAERSSGAGGAGATAPAGLGGPAVPIDDGPPAPFTGGSTPEDTLIAFFAAMRLREASPDLDLYTAATRQMLRERGMTPAQQQMVLAAYSTCPPGEARIGPGGGHAVIRYAPAERRCAPWFFRREDDAWKLDLATMQSAMRFGRRNEWHFVGEAPEAYRFGFIDWRFDAFGFPVISSANPG